MKYQNIREEELKNKVGQDYFSDYDTSQIIGNIDFTVTSKTKDKNQQKAFEEHSLLWAEAKTGSFDLISMFAQLILTIGKARTFDKSLPPAFLGAFDFQKMAFVPYEKVQHLFFKNDFNWNVTASNHETKEFKEIHTLIETILKSDKYEYQFGKDDKELQFFIKNNIAKATESGKIQIDKNNFVPIYLRWLDIVKPIINFDFTEGKKQQILDSDFYLADLFVDDYDTASTDDDTPLKEELFVVFKNGHYEIAKENLKSLFNAIIDFRDKKAYEQFWKRYKRPPIKEFQDYIIERRDLLVPQDIRERKGAFFTPFQWVELSQKYLADTLGENWQEEYYVWDCAAGTGNLLAGLTNKYNIWASTLDQADVNVMHDRITHGANLLQNHVFQFDFLNDDFTKLPQGLQDIINDETKRKKLVIYINPPYAEASSYGTESIPQVSIETKNFKKYKDEIGAEALNELFAQFFIRIYKEIPNTFIASFSTPKYITSEKFIKFRNTFKAEFKKGFVCQADTFDNVKGKFPIGFFIWDTENKKEIKKIKPTIYESDKGAKNIHQLGIKTFSIVKDKSIGEWRTTFYSLKEQPIGYIIIVGPSMQSNNNTYITNEVVESYKKKGMIANITISNIIMMSIYLAIRKVINANWLNNKDLYLYPNKKWQQDKEFHNDCLTFTLFDNSNNIQSNFGINNWIPFTEKEVNAKEKFASNFMTDFITGKIKPETLEDNLFEVNEPKTHYEVPLKFSDESKAVFDAGRELWKYYHSQKSNNVNASFYDIRAHFQGRNDKGRMNSKSADKTYTKLIGTLRENLNLLADKIAPKVYEFGFLKE